MRGDYPPCNTQVVWITSKQGGVSYVYGGILPDDKAYIPTNDLFSLRPEADTLTWSHLNVGIVKRLFV